MNRQYPYVGIYSGGLQSYEGLKVLFTGANTGEVLEPGKFITHHKKGDVLTDWTEIRNFTPTGEEVMRRLKAGDIIVGSQNKTTGNVSFAASPSLHGSLAEARIEAERLAGLDPSKRFLVVDIKGVCEATTVAWS